jgi:hypothetical protein
VKKKNLAEILLLIFLCHLVLAFSTNLDVFKFRFLLLWKRERREEKVDRSFLICGGIFKQSIMEARNRLGIGLSYRPARLHSLAELVPWNQFLGSLKV